MLELSWVKCRVDAWCRLNDVDLKNVSGNGVYVIWLVQDEGTLVQDDGTTDWIYVGQGSIRDRLEFHRVNDDVQRYAESGTLYVTWARVSSPKQRNGVERYLADKLQPWEGQHPDVPPIKVNIPT